MDTSPEPADTPADAPPPALLIIAAVLGVGLAVTVAVIGLTSGGEPPPAPAPRAGALALPPVDAPDADDPACRRLTRSLPGALPSGGQNLPRRPLASPAPPGAAAWGVRDPVVLRCGLPKPSQLTSTSRLRQVDGVRWLPVIGQTSTTFYAVDRPVYVALTVPDGSGTGPLQAVSDAVDAALKPQRVRS